MFAHFPVVLKGTDVCWELDGQTNKVTRIILQAVEDTLDIICPVVSYVVFFESPVFPC